MTQKTVFRIFGRSDLLGSHSRVKIQAVWPYWQTLAHPRSTHFAK